MHSGSFAIRLTALAAGLLLALAPGPAAGHVHAQTSQPAKLRVEITDDGFDGKADGLTLDVEQGQPVELTFVWAQKSHPNDEHIVVLPAYKLESDKITATNREYTFKFLADKSGTFDFKCDLDCEVHDRLKVGSIRVRRAGEGAASPAAALNATTLRLTPTAGRESVTLMALLTDKTGAPVSKAELRFFVDAEFVGTKGKMEIGQVKTDGNGVAFLDYRPTLPAEQQTITAQFEGMGMYGESQQAVTLPMSSAGALAPAYTVAPIGLGPIRGTAPLILALVILGVWTTFGFVLVQVHGMWRDRTDA